MTDTSPSSIKIFLSFAHEDEKLKKGLETHLTVLERNGLITSWYNREITAGSDWETSVAEYLNDAQLIILLISPHYLASDYCYSVEMKRALERHYIGDAFVIPVILRPVDWQDAPFGKLQVLPTSGKPISTWSNRDAAFTDVVSGIRDAIEQLKSLHPFPQILPDSPDTVNILGSPQKSHTQANPSTSNTISPLPEENQLAQAILRQGRFERGAIEKNATADIPIRHIEEDKLNFNVYVSALRDFIASQDTSTPLTIGIYGSWGSGKSSLMRMIQTELDPPIDFWKYLRLNWLRIVWLFFFFTTLPLWLIGQLVLWIGSRTDKAHMKWFQRLNEDLNYEYEANSLSKIRLHNLRFWQRISVRHYSNNPSTHPTIWFNAWKFDEEEQLWAALAIEVLNQIKNKYNFFQRIFFWFRLSLKRLSLSSFAKVTALPLFLGFIDWIYTSYMKELPNIFIQIFGYQIALGQFLLGMGIIISTFIQILKIAKDPFQIEVKGVFDKPNYKDKIGFIGNFDEDFSRIVSLITKPHLGQKPQKLVIFIDDLDRCKAPKAADIIEGINLFLDSKGCVFVLGMDLAAVVASIENKYESLFKKMQEENVDVISPGKLFLDKIIQVPFQVPPSKEEGMHQLIKSILWAKEDLLNYQNLKTRNTDRNNNHAQQGQIVTSSLPPLFQKGIQSDPASYKRDDVSDAISEGAQFISKNPRQIKRFINLFRLYVYIVDARNLLKFGEDSTGKQLVGLTLKRLAIWVAWSMKWAELVKSLHQEAQLSREELRAYLLKLSKSVQRNGHWLTAQDSVDWSLYDSLVATFTTRKQEEINSTWHWSYLPWSHWLLDKDFLRCVKELELFWQQPQDITKEDDWLHIVLTMDSITTPTGRDTSAKNDVL